MEITKDDLFDVVKTYALISIRYSKPNAVNIYNNERTSKNDIIKSLF